jgi:protease II
MKKHILGLVIFSLIIGVSAFFYGIFGFETKSCNYKKKRHHRKHHEKTISDNANIIKQAVFNKNENTFNFKLGKLDADTGIIFHFYAKSNNETRYLRGIIAQYKPEIEIKNKKKAVFRIDEDNSLFNLSENENLYVIPELIYEGSDASNNIPKFDHNSAVAVLNNFGN